MMPATVAELAAGRAVAVANLFEFEFQSATKRFWNGLHWLTAGGQQWQGSGTLISVSGLEYAEGLGASAATFQLSGANSELVEYAAASEVEVTERPCAVYIQFLSARYVPLDDPVAIWVGTMDSMSFSGSVSTMNIALTAETLFIDRSRAPNGYMTDTDQQARYPGDLGFSFMPFLRNKTVTWLRT